MELRKNLDTEENREFWASAARARKEVESWPEWKQNVRVTQYSKGIQKEVNDG